MIKIADFGLTREINSRPPYTEYISTRWYRAPELLLHASYYSLFVDIWAFGCILGELFTLQPLFPGRSELDQLFKICLAIGSPNKDQWPELQELSSKTEFVFPQTPNTNLKNLLTSCSDTGLNLIKLILIWVPHQRPKADVIMKHPFYRTIS